MKNFIATELSKSMIDRFKLENTHNKWVKFNLNSISIMVCKFQWRKERYIRFFMYKMGVLNLSAYSIILSNHNILISNPLLTTQNDLFPFIFMFANKSLTSISC